MPSNTDIYEIFAKQKREFVMTVKCGGWENSSPKNWGWNLMKKFINLLVYWGWDVIMGKLIIRKKEQKPLMKNKFYFSSELGKKKIHHHHYHQQKFVWVT